MVACGAASHLRLKRLDVCPASRAGQVACGAASHLRLKPGLIEASHESIIGRMWSGFSSEIETVIIPPDVMQDVTSHVERLLI